MLAKLLMGAAESGIIENGLNVYFDAANPVSYPGSGTTWTDLSGNTNNATLVNGVTYSSSDYGYLNFDGVNDYGNFGTNFLISRTTPFTITMWFKGNWRTAAGSNPFHRLITLRTSGTPTFGIAYCTVRTAGYLGLYFGANSGWSLATTDQLVTTGTWNSFTVTYNGAGSTTIGNFKMYLNTTQLSLITSGLIAPAALTDANLLATRTTAAEVQIFNGSISTAYIYNRVLTNQELTQNHNAIKWRYGL